MATGRSTTTRSLRTRTVSTKRPTTRRSAVAKAVVAVSRKFDRTDWLVVLGLTLLAALTRFVNLPHPREIVFDETYFANFAHNYLTNTKFFDAEPPLAKYIIAGGIKLFGFNPFGWRVMPALFGTAVIPLMYLFAKRLFGGRVIPTFAALLALLDGLLLVESRTAVIDIFVVFFNLVTYICLLLSLQARDRIKSLGWLAATGVSFGLALSVKWITLAFLAPALMLIFFVWFSYTKAGQRFFKKRSSKKLWDSIGIRRENIQHPLSYLTFLGILPVAIYIGLFAIHVPFDSTGESIWGIHKQIFNYHRNLTATHPYGSAWYTWPFLERPVAYYFKADGGGWQAIVALGNPIIWWGGLLAVAYAVWRASWKLVVAALGFGIVAALTGATTAGIGALAMIGVAALLLARRGELAIALLLFIILAHYGPWSLITRVLFIYHYMGALPFVMVLGAWVLGRSWDWKPRDPSVQVTLWTLLLVAIAGVGGLLGRSVFGDLGAVPAFMIGAAVPAIATMWFALGDFKQLHWGQKQAIAFIGLVALTFIYFYPVWTGVGLSPADYYRHMWLKSWI